MGLDLFDKLATGWAYTDSGKPVAYVMSPGNPATAQFFAFPTWWQALAFAVIYAERDPCCEFLGGPGQ